MCYGEKCQTRELAELRGEIDAILTRSCGTPILMTTPPRKSAQESMDAFLDAWTDAFGEPDDDDDLMLDGIELEEIRYDLDEEAT